MSIDPPPLGGDESAERPGFTWSPDWPPPPEVPQAETALKATGLVIVVLLAAMSALYEVLYSPLSSGTTRLPVSLILAIVFNPLLALAAYWSTGRRLTALLPGLAWCAVFFLAATKTREGDLLLTDQNWVGLVTLLAGPVAFAVAVFVPIMREQQRALRENPIEPPAPRKAQPTPGKAPAPGSKPKKAGAPLRPAAKKR